MGRLGLLRMFAALGTRQDEQELRAAERMEKDRATACSEIRARMRRNEIYCKQNMADAKLIHERLVDDVAKSKRARDQTQAELNNVSRKLGAADSRCETLAAKIDMKVGARLLVTATCASDAHTIEARLE